MSKDIELLNFEEDLDYELDVDMNVQDEDALLEDDKCDNESELIRKMSATSVSAVELTDTPVTTSEPLPALLHTPSDFWNKSISTFVNVMKTSPIITTNEAVTLQDTLDSNGIQEPVMEASAPVQSHQDVHDDERKDATETDALQSVSVEPHDFNSTSSDVMEMCQSEKLAVTSSSSSTSTSSSSKRVQSKRNRNKKRKYRNVLLNGFVHSKYRNTSIPSLMSVNTQIPFPRTKFPLLIPVNDPVTQTTRKKVPFIIQSNGNASRTVSLNPEFNGFAARNVVNVIQQNINRNRDQSVQPNKRRPASATTVDLNSVVINKRRSTTSLESISKSDKKPLDSSIVTAGMSDEDYLVAIADQKKKREEVLRQKEWKRGSDEGWTFLE